MIDHEDIEMNDHTRRTDEKIQWTSTFPMRPTEIVIDGVRVSRPTRLLDNGVVIAIDDAQFYRTRSHLPPASSNPQRDWEIEVLTNMIEIPGVSHAAMQFFPDYMHLVCDAMIKARKD